MPEQTPDKAPTPHREQTDESLRIEREKADLARADKRDTVEDAADRVVREARERADELVQEAREQADGVAASPSSAVEREREQADAAVERERARDDARIERQRIERTRRRDAFLAVEREATDEDLLGERADADAKIATRDEFLGVVSHDLRSLLNGLALNAQIQVELAAAGPAGEHARKHGSTSQRMVARMNRLVNDLLDIVGLEAGQLALVSETVQVASLVQESLEAFMPIATAKRVALEADRAEMPPVAHLDGDRILQVLANLLGNAIKFTPAGGRVLVRVRGEGDQLRLSVSDTGPGIPAGDLERIFERFRQLHRDRRGLGLGLYISKGIVEAHGGKLWAESTPGAGSTFHVALPCLPARAT